MFPKTQKLEAVEILRDELTFVVPPKHLLARRRSVDIKELGEETFIAHNVESPYRSRVIQLFEKYRVPLQRDVEMPTIESIKRFVQWAWAWPSSRACACNGRSSANSWLKSASAR